jgi:molybdenum cofactor biosynthesis enzyme
MNDLTHFSASGRARMVDVSEKSGTQHIALGNFARMDTR